MRINVTTAEPGSRSETVNLNEEAPGRWEQKSTTTRASSVDCKETPTTLVLTLEMEPVEPGSLDVTVKGRTLVVEHERKEEKRVVSGSEERVERSVEKRSREVELPCDVHAEKAEAVYEAGKLRITLPKRGPEKIPVSAG